jgi:hypothetical protein
VEKVIGAAKIAGRLAVARNELRKATTCSLKSVHFSFRRSRPNEQ